MELSSMSSKTAGTTSYMQVMEASGFYRNGVPTSGVIEASSLRNNPQQLDKRIKYSVVINPEQLNAKAIFELSGSPCIYFTQLEESAPDPQELARLHRLSWNHGLAPMLWVVTPTKVLLYSCYSKPTEEDRNNPEQHLIELFQQTEDGLNKLNQYASRRQIESGEFWKWVKAKQIDRNKRVDAILVKDLTDTEKNLVENNGLKRSVAQTLLIQSIFVAYLQEREILSHQFLLNNFGFNSFAAILEDKPATENLFSWIKRTFNGNLLSLSSEEIDSVQPKHLKVIRDFIGGQQEIKTGQLRLWRAYDFKAIPVELISAIYEKFIYAEDAKSAEDNSPHYTPINLVDLVLSEVFKELDGNAKILDLACGSGVFLVDALRRLVVKRLVSGERHYRQLIRDTLYNQIFGVDIKRKAVQIAAFSLYLTALELDYELEQNPSISDDLKFQEIIGRNLFSSNAFDENAEFNRVESFARKQFNAIVGNPPWTKSGSTKSASEYCQYKHLERNLPVLAWLRAWLTLHSRLNIKFKAIQYIACRLPVGYLEEYSTANGTPPDQAFLWRIGDFTNKETQIGLILHGKPFFSSAPQARQAKEALLRRFKPQVIINLSKLRSEKLFPKSTAPAMVLIAKDACSEAKGSFYFVCPERSLDYRRHGMIEIGSENIKRLPVIEAASDPDMLKVASWGTARDLHLIQFLRESFPPLARLLNQEGWNSGRGFFSGSDGKEAPELYGKKLLPANYMPKYQVNTAILHPLTQGKLERSRNPKIYKSPLVIATRGIKASGFFAAFSQEDVVYVDTYIGISIPPEESDMAHYLNGILNSALATYFLFLTSSSWGVERDKVESQDLERLPIPLPNRNNERTVNQVIAVEEKLRHSRTEAEQESFQQELDEVIFNLYGLNATEQVVVKDSINFTIDWFMKRGKSKAIQRPKLAELESYAKHLISVIQPFLQTLKERMIVAEVIDVGKAPLQVVKFSVLHVSSQQPIVQTVSGQKLETVLKRIAEQLPQNIADRIYTRRDLRIYAGKDIYIVKPAKRIYWTRSAGLNDADIILAEHLGVGNASFR